MAGERWTPGPWVVGSPSPSIAPGWIPVIAVREVGAVPYETDTVAWTTPLRPSKAEAVAHLLASAPDLYAACLPLANADPDNPPPGVPVEDWRGAVLAARAAMAKARGET